MDIMDVRGIKPLSRWTGRDLDPRLPDCESGVRTRLNYRPVFGLCVVCFFLFFCLSWAESNTLSAGRSFCGSASWSCLFFGFCCVFCMVFLGVVAGVLWCGLMLVAVRIGYSEVVLWVVKSV